MDQFNFTKKPLVFLPNKEDLNANSLDRFYENNLLTLEDDKGHFEIYEAFRPMARILRWLGMLPLVQDEETGLRIHFKVFSWITFYTLFPVVTLMAAAYVATNFYAVNLTNKVEKFTTTFYLVVSIGCSIVSILASAYKARSYKRFFLSWHNVDRLLQVDHDRGLRRLGRILATTYFIFVALGILITIFILVQRISKKEKDISSNNVVFFAIIVWVTLDVGAFSMPDYTFLFLAKAIEIRLKLVKKELAAIVQLTVFDLSNEFEKFRLAYHLLVEMVTTTNRLLSPVLLITCMANGVQILMAIYGLMLKQESPNVAWSALKIVFGLLGLTKFSLLCLFGSMVAKAAGEIGIVLRKAQTINVSPATKFEIHMFMLETTKPKVNFTASGYFTICLSFLSTVMGVITTYWITIYQFDSSKNIVCPTCNATICEDVQQKYAV